MNFDWTENQKELRETAIKFAENKLNNDVINKDKRSEFPHDEWKMCAEFGLQGMLFPEAYGGMGFGLFDIVAVLEGIGYGCKDRGLLFSINAHVWACEVPIYHFGTEEQKKKYLPRLCKGDSIGANAMTEPDTGSDISALKTTAKKDKDYYILNGSKTFVTNAPVADIFIIYARTGKTKGFAGISCFLVEKGMEGLTVGKHIEKMGLRTSPMAEVVFDNCKVPKENMIGNEGSGSLVLNDSMEWERIFILTSWIGSMERQIETCVRYIKVRKSGNKFIGQYQSVANKIVEMRIRFETSRLLLYRTVWLKSNKEQALMQASMTKLYISEACIRNCRDALQIFGGYGYTVEYEIERELRDALATTLYSGTSEIQKNIIAKYLI